MRLDVDCYSGHKDDERPIRFRLDGNEYLVEDVLDQWYGPSVSAPRILPVMVRRASFKQRYACTYTRGCVLTERVHNLFREPRIPAVTNSLSAIHSN